MRNFLFSIVIASILTACASGNTYAPVTDIATIQRIPSSGKKIIRRGDTLYKIAWQYGLDYRDLARRNHITSPYILDVGQRIYLRGRAPTPKRTTKKITKPKRQSYKPVNIFSGLQKKLLKQIELAHRSPSAHKMRPRKDPVMSKRWRWPVKGKIVKRYAGLNKGINISNRFATPIYAANAGRVVYSGNGLRGYGNLIIIKHSGEYMSAYAHNSKMHVKDGDVVRKGQKIAEMGSSGSKNVMLHFEIRRNGRPINPLKILN